MTPRDQAWQEAIARRKLDIEAANAAKSVDAAPDPLDGQAEGEASAASIEQIIEARRGRRR